MQILEEELRRLDARTGMDMAQLREVELDTLLLEKLKRQAPTSWVKSGSSPC